MEKQPTSAFIKNYFLIANSFLLVLSLIAFSDNLFYDIHQKSNSDPKFIIHGLFFLAWFIILVIQSAYVNKGDIKTHMRLGKIGMLIGLGVVLSTFYVFAAVYKGWSVMPLFVKSNRILTIIFAVFLLLAYLKRKNSIQHKRCLFMGTLYVLQPILDRAVGKTYGYEGYFSGELVMMVIWNAFFISLFVYDWTTLKKIHPITWGGVLLFYSIWLVSQVL